MKMGISSSRGNMAVLATRLGYRRAPAPEGELAFAKSLTVGEYPRFHIYVKKDEKREVYAWTLHLDQKKPSYFGTHAHNAEYDGAVIRREAERIKEFVIGF